jgi:starvation-inducible DNA-binding protein
MASNNNLVQGLKELQSMAMKMYAQSHGLHWNVVGATFKQDHAFLLEIYEDVFDSIDTYAESLRKLGIKAPFGLLKLQSNSILKINDSLDLTTEQMFAELNKTNLQIIDKLKDVFDVATEERENGIANFLADRQDKHSFWKWQIISRLS